MSTSVWARYEVMTEKGWRELGECSFNTHPLCRVFDDFAEHDVLALMDDYDKSFTSVKAKDMEHYWFSMRKGGLLQGADVLLRKYYEGEKRRLSEDEYEDLCLLEAGAHIMIAMYHESQAMCEKKDMWCVSDSDVRVMFFKC